MPSCCLTCSDWRRADSLARSASTRLPMPFSRASDSLVTKVEWISRDFEPVPRRASAELSVSRPASIAATAVLAAATELISVAVPMDRVPPVRLRSSAPMVMVLEPSALASAVMSEAPLAIRLVPLNSALATMVPIWSRSALKSSFSALRDAVSRDASLEARAFSFISTIRSEMASPAARATSTVDWARSSDCDTAL